MCQAEGGKERCGWKTMQSERTMENESFERRFLARDSIPLIRQKAASLVPHVTAKPGTDGEGSQKKRR